MKCPICNKEIKEETTWSWGESLHEETAHKNCVIDEANSYCKMCEQFYGDKDDDFCDVCGETEVEMLTETKKIYLKGRLK